MTAVMAARERAPRIATGVSGALAARTLYSLPMNPM